MDAQSREKPSGDERAHDSDHDITDQPEAISFDNQAGQEARNCSDDEKNNQTFDTHFTLLEVNFL